MARATLRETLAQQQRALLRSVLRNRAAGDPSETLATWIVRSRVKIERAQRALDEMQMTDQTDFATLSVALNEVGRLV
jgi:NAD-specific glutamate dehydrogenase